MAYKIQIRFGVIEDWRDIAGLDWFTERVQGLAYIRGRLKGTSGIFLRVVPLRYASVCRNVTPGDVQVQFRRLTNLVESLLTPEQQARLQEKAHAEDWAGAVEMMFDFLGDQLCPTNAFALELARFNALVEQLPPEGANV